MNHEAIDSLDWFFSHVSRFPPESTIDMTDLLTVKLHYLLRTVAVRYYLENTKFAIDSVGYKPAQVFPNQNLFSWS